MKLRSFFLMFTALSLCVGTGIRGATPDLKKSLKTEKMILPKVAISETVAKKSPVQEFVISKSEFSDLSLIAVLPENPTFEVRTDEVASFKTNAQKLTTNETHYQYRRARDGL